MSVKRYEMSSTYNYIACEDQVVEVECSDGQYVKFSDYDQLQQRNAELELLLQTAEQNAADQRDMKNKAREQRDKQVKKNAELAAQVEQIRSAWVSHDFNEINKMIIATPAQCLAEHDREVAARAVLASIESVNGYVTVSQVPSRDFAAGWNGAVKGIEMHANKIKSGEIEI